MSNCKVSIVVPVFNVEKYLHRCIHSLLNQTLHDIEIILVDDGSTDKSAMLCDEFIKQDSRIKVIHKDNAGLGFARNSGLKVATGEYVGFIDSDDYIDVNMFTVLYSKAEKHNADYVRCEHILEDQNGTVLDKFDDTVLEEGFYNKDKILNSLVYPLFGKDIKDGKNGHVGFSVCRAIFRKAILDNYDITFVSEREYISEDIIFNLDFLVKANTAYVSLERLYHYVRNNNSLTQVFRIDRFQKQLHMSKYLEQKALTYDMPENCTIRIKRQLLDANRRFIKIVAIKSDYNLINKYRIIRCSLNSKEFREIFSDFPINRLPFKYKAIAYLLKYRLAMIMMLLAKRL